MRLDFVADGTNTGNGGLTHFTPIVYYKIVGFFTHFTHHTACGGNAATHNAVVGTVFWHFSHLVWSGWHFQQYNSRLAFPPRSFGASMRMGKVSSQEWQAVPDGISVCVSL
jgi:hypothetical protein